jgi:hypothetical protein
MALARTAAPAKRKPTGTTERGTGSGEYKVKGRRATKKQRDTIDGCLRQAQEDRASRRVMIATVMCITQESGAGELANVMTGNDDVGIFQQGRNWISEEGSKDPEKSTHAFLITGPTSWKKRHGGVKKAPGNLSLAIHAVQGNKDPNAYAQWEDEATRTVDAFTEGGGGDSGGGSYTKQYTFTRGEKGGSPENSWDAMARLTDEVGAHRWAAANVLYAASGDELRQQAPSLTIHGDEGWLLKQPSWSWASNRAISEITLEALSDRWDVMPGGCVVLPRPYGAMQGKWLVWNVSGTSLTSPETTIVLRRPTRLKSEPAAEKGTRSEDGGEGGGDLKDICKRISDVRHTYVWGGSHGPALSKLKDSSPFDCSSAVSYALYKAGLFGDRKVAIVSGEFARSYGKPGKGDDFTVMANATHVWIEFADGSRFDTSQHSGKSGPMYTTVKRSDQARFTKRHHPSH